MSPEPQSVVEFGPPAEPQPSRRRASLTDVVSGLARDRRTGPLAAAVGAVALFGSLVSEWQITDLDLARLDVEPGGERQLTAGLTDLGALGNGYMVGLFVLVGAAVQLLFGPPAGRRRIRLAGLTAGGVLLALLAALAETLSDGSRPLGSFISFSPTEEQMQLSYGRGLWCAVAGVALVTLAIWLSDREGDAGPALSWRRSPAPEEDARPEEPFQLEVTAARPFVSGGQDVDAPAQREAGNRDEAGPPPPVA